MSRAARAAGLLLAAGTLVVLASTGTQNAVANGDTRTLRFYNIHTKETLTVTFKRNGQYDAAAMKQVSWFMRDWRKNQATTMEPRLMDVVWEVYRDTGSKEPINVVCGYRSPGTNEMLRSRTRGVAKFSQHTLGRAMDFFIPGVSISSIREAGIRLQRGGVGYYPTSGSPFVHLDIGNVRAWPRMSRTQLARLFPGGRTVHMPAEGGRMPGYEVAMADLQKRGSTINRAWNASPPGTVTVADAAAPASGKKRNFLARLLGMDEEDDEEGASAPTQTGRERETGREKAVASTKPSAAPPAAVPATAAPAAAPEPADIQTASRAQLAVAAKPAVIPVPPPAPFAKEPLVAALPPTPTPIPVRTPLQKPVEQADSGAVLAYAQTSTLPPPPLPADPALEPVASKGPGLLWVNGPAGTEIAPPSAVVPAADSAADVVTLPGTIVPAPRRKPAVQTASAAAPALRGNANPSLAVANRIASAYSQAAPARTSTPGSESAPGRSGMTNPVFALATRIATANAAVRPLGRPVSEPTGSSAGSTSKLPENFAERARQLVGERVALAYAGPNVSAAGSRARTAVMAVSLNRSIALAAPRPPVKNAALLTVRLDRKGWQTALRPERARVDASAAPTPPSAEPALLAAPREAMPFGFGTDPSYGTKTDRFTGAPVMFIRTVSFTAPGSTTAD